MMKKITIGLIIINIIQIILGILMYYRGTSFPWTGYFSGHFAFIIILIMSLRKE